MQHSEIIESLNFIKPDAKWVLQGLDLLWQDEEQDEPTQLEIEAGWVAYKAAQQAEAEAKAAQKAALLDKLGITEDEAKLLLS
jgi:hypothetical protein